MTDQKVDPLGQKLLTADAFNPTTSRLVQEAQALKKESNSDGVVVGQAPALTPAEATAASTPTGDSEAIVVPTIPQELNVLPVPTDAAVAAAESAHDITIEQAIFDSAEQALKTAGLEEIVTLERAIGQVPNPKT